METMMPIASTSISVYLNPYSSSSLPTIRRVTVPAYCFSSHLAAFNRVWWPRNLRKTTPLVWSGKKSPPPLKTAIRSGGSNKVREINESEFYDVVLKSERPVLVEFVATWCGPCRLIAPAIEFIAQPTGTSRPSKEDKFLRKQKEYQEKLMVAKVDHDLNPRLIEEYKVYGLPTLIVFQNGQEVPESRREGAITKVKLKEYVDKLMDSVSII